MKAFLMHRDRDFDPQQVLTRREVERRHNRGRAATQLMLPWNAQALRQDLGLDIVFDAMSSGDRFLNEVAQIALLSILTDLDAIEYRQRILLDCINNPHLVREIYQIAIDAIEGERANYWSIFNRYPTGILHHAVDVLQMFVGKLKLLHGVAERHAGKFESEGLSRLCATLRQELDDGYFAEVEEHLSRLKFRRGTLISAHLGKGSKGKDHVLRKLPDDTRIWLARRLFAERPQGYSFRLHPRDEAGARALSELSDRGVNLVANALAQSTDHILSFFQMLRTELAFYVGCLNLREQLAELDEPICIPTPFPINERNASFAGLYDASLALSMRCKVVGNDRDADQSDLIIITGANTGGKSTFLRSVGLAQLMMQAGMYVPAESFSAEVCAGVYTHYRRDEDSAMESGKWEEEIGRMSEIVDRLNPNSLMLFNESFASTNEREGSEIASHVVDALLTRRVKVFYVTHLYHFARSFFGRKFGQMTFLRAERRPDGTRPFKLIEAGPLQTSYGEDLYRTIFYDDGTGSSIRTRQSTKQISAK
jgi:MutS domain V